MLVRFRHAGGGWVSRLELGFEIEEGYISMYILYNSERNLTHVLYNGYSRRG